MALWVDVLQISPCWWDRVSLLLWCNLWEAVFLQISWLWWKHLSVLVCKACQHGGELVLQEVQKDKTNYCCESSDQSFKTSIHYQHECDLILVLWIYLLFWELMKQNTRRAFLRYNNYVRGIYYIYKIWCTGINLNPLPLVGISSKVLVGYLTFFSEIVTLI